MEATAKITETQPARAEGPHETRKTKAVYTITERQGRSFWTRVGLGFINRDGSLNLRLDAIPVSGTLHVRDHEPREEREGGGRFDGPYAGLARAERRDRAADKTATADLPF